MGASVADPRFRRGRRAAGSTRGRAMARLARLGRLVAAAAGVIALVAVATLVARASARLTVDRVHVTGNEQMALGDVLAQLDGLQGQPMLAVDLAAWRRRLEASPWVRHAALRRVLPGTIEVAISERRPLAIARVGDRLVLVDVAGEAIDDFGPNYDGFDLPIVDGLGQPAAGGRPARAAQRAAVVASLLGDLAADAALLAKVSQVDVSDPGNVVIWLDDDPVRLLVGDRDFRKRLGGYLEVRDAVRARVADLETVDLRFERRVFARAAAGPSGGRRRAATTAPRARS